MKNKVWVMSEHNGWGDNITWLNWNKRRLCGHTTPHPSVGDELLCPFISGKVGRFKFKTVTPCCDPRDMWFADAEDVGFVEEENSTAALKDNDHQTNSIPTN